jgi:transposase
VQVACALDQLGRQLATRQAGTTPAGYRGLLAWARSLGEVRAWGGEGPAAMGPPVDAGVAAQAVLAGQMTAIPKPGDHLVEMVRDLRVARATAVKACSQAANALRALVVTAPAELGQQLPALPAKGWPARRCGGGQGRS